MPFLTKEELGGGYLSPEDTQASMASRDARMDCVERACSLPPIITGGTIEQMHRFVHAVIELDVLLNTGTPDAMNELRARVRAIMGMPQDDPTQMHYEKDIERILNKLREDALYYSRLLWNSAAGEDCD